MHRREILSSKIRQTRRSSKAKRSKLCQHCGKNVLMKTYARHRRLYYDSAKDCWKTTVMAENMTEPQVEVSEHPTCSSEVSEHPICSSDCTEDDEYMDEQPSFADVSEEEQSSGTEEMWEEGNEELLESEIDFVPTECPRQATTSSTSESALLTWLLLFLLRLQARHYIPDSAVNCLLKFLYTFLLILGRQSAFVARLSAIFPKSVYEMQKHFGIQEEFTRFVVCKKCYSVYNFKDCIERHSMSKTCIHRQHPNSRVTCGALLLKSVTISSGRVLLYPFKVFCYQNLSLSLQQFLLRPGFAESCEHWRSWNESTTELRDVYDGKLWREHQFIDGKPALASPYVYAVMINIDWFQPFKLTQASVGAMYLTILNLPYKSRFKRENIILLGVIPGPSEPPRDINDYLKPFVDEMINLFDGIPMKIHGKSIPTIVRCVLLGVACDMPASRKTCGYLSHSANLGCTKCYKVFSGQVGSKDYSGFDRDTWRVRTNSEHRSHIHEIQNASTVTSRNMLESKYGCRYSILLQLPYFDPTRMLAIDPMHNLFLGTVKHIVKDIWIGNNTLSPSSLRAIQDHINSMQVPPDIGRIPHKIDTGFSGCTADQYKNWVTLYSVPCLYSFLDQDQLECWRHFVLACRLLCKRSLTHSDLSIADALLLRFCRRTEQIYGKECITPNMHMHCHLRSVILDFGPIYAFWLFSYERFNGILGKQPSNNRSIEIQLMRRFNRDSTAYALQPPDEFKEELGDISSLDQRLIGSLLITERITDNENFELGSSCTCHVFPSDDVDKLKLLLGKILLLSPEEVSVNSSFRKYKYITLKDIRYDGTTKKKPSICFANWNEQLFGPSPTQLTCNTLINPADVTLRPVKIEYFVKISYTVNGVSDYMCFVFVSWHQPHPHRFEIGKPAQVWCHQLFEVHGLQSFLPIKDLQCRCVHSIMKLHDEEVLVVVPLIE